LHGQGDGLTAHLHIGVAQKVLIPLHVKALQGDQFPGRKGAIAILVGGGILDREGRLVGALGSPGGPSILAYNARALIATLDWGLPVQSAFNLPNLVARGDGFGADTERFSEALRAGLTARGVTLRPGQRRQRTRGGRGRQDGRQKKSDAATPPSRRTACERSPPSNSVKKRGSRLMPPSGFTSAFTIQPLMPSG